MCKHYYRTFRLANRKYDSLGTLTVMECYIDVLCMITLKLIICIELVAGVIGQTERMGEKPFYF